MSTREELKVTFKRRYWNIKTDERVYQKMCAIHMGQLDVEAYYEWLTKFNSVFVFLRAHDSFLKEVFRFGL
jgi:hypothetical protein